MIGCTRGSELYFGENSFLRWPRRFKHKQKRNCKQKKKMQTKKEKHKQHKNLKQKCKQKSTTQKKKQNANKKE